MLDFSKALSRDDCSAADAQQYHHLGRSTPEWRINYVPEKYSREAACLQQCPEAQAVPVPPSGPESRSEPPWKTLPPAPSTRTMALGKGQSPGRPAPL